MKKSGMIKIYWILSVVMLWAFVFSAVSYGNDSHKPITQELMNLIAEKPEIGKLLEMSINRAKEINPDPKTNPVQDLSAFFALVDKMSVLVPHPAIGDDMHYFFFLVDQPLAELSDKKLFKNSIQFYDPFATWLRHLAAAWGEFLDSEASWNETIYQRFYDDPRFGLQHGWYESPSNWKTWNQFFSRRLKSPDVRPIASPDDPSVVVSPADSVPQGIWKIDKQSRILAKNGVKVKKESYFSIEDLLGPDSAFKNAFAEGVLTHTYLSPTDYHRYHFPVGGVVKEKKIISKNVVVEIDWNAEKRNYEVIDSLGWQFSQTRGIVVLDTEKYGLVAVIPVGMDFVSSVNFEDNVQVGSIHKKGDMLGTFKFGGSDIIMLFQKSAGFTMKAPMADEKTYKHIFMGETYGVFEAK